MKNWQIALLRAAGGGAVLGLSTFLAAWATTDEVKTLVLAFGTPFLGTIITRGAVEGWWDTAKS